VEFVSYVLAINANDLVDWWRRPGTSVTGDRRALDHGPARPHNPMHPSRLALAGRRSPPSSQERSTP